MDFDYHENSNVFLFPRATGLAAVFAAGSDLFVSGGAYAHPDKLPDKNKGEGL